MPEERDLLARRLSREDLLKLAAVTGGAGLVAGRTGHGSGRERAPRERRPDGSRFWTGPDTGTTAAKPCSRSTSRRTRTTSRKFTYMGNEADALAKIHAGLKPDLFRPYVGWVKYFATSGLVQPWDTKLISNFKHLNPFMVKAGQYQRQAVRDPGRLGLRRDPLPQRQGEAEGEVLEPPVRRTLQGQDRLVRRHHDAHRLPASISGSRTRGTRRTTNSSGHRSSSSPRSTSSGRTGRPRPICGSSSGPATSGSPTRGRTTGCR